MLAIQFTFCQLSVCNVTVYNYTVEVYTGFHPMGNTDSNVYVTIFGSGGDTGERHLLDPDREKTHFRSGHVCLSLNPTVFVYTT